jgi:hypothetical protein
MNNKKSNGIIVRKAKTAQQNKYQREWSKQLIADVRVLLWVVTLGGLFLAWKCINQGYLGSLPWVASMVGLPWAAHGTICSFYLNMAKSDHRKGGITYEQAKANNFKETLRANINSPQI